MPKMMMNSYKIAGSGTFEFSAARPETLGSTEYTLVSLVVDISSSVNGFKNELVNMIKASIEACQKTSRVDNLIVRVTTFNDSVSEVHGFIPLNKLDPSSYNLYPSGYTSLYDATYESVSATSQYAKTLADQDFDVNAVVFIITDGADNRSTVGPKEIAKTISNTNREEYLDSMQVILIGINDAECQSYLDDFHVDAKLDSYISAGNADAKSLARLGKFISKSISSTSQTLGSGAVASLTF